jgi:hypothetical protein
MRKTNFKHSLNKNTSIRYEILFLIFLISLVNTQLIYANNSIVDTRFLDELLDESLISNKQYNTKKEALQSINEKTNTRSNIKTLQSGTSSISGQLTDENGNPIEFQMIKLVEALSLTTTVANVVTNATGNYTIPNLNAGDYVLYSRGNGYLSYVWQSSASGGPQLCSGCVNIITVDNYITVAAGQAVTGIDISTRLGGVVSGFIKDANTNIGVTNLTAFLYNVAGSFYTTSTSVIDPATGVYTIDAVPNGTYKLYLTDSQVGSNNLHIPQLYPNIECNVCSKLAMQGLGEDLNINNFNSINNINFNMQIGASISGKILDATTGNAIPNYGLFLVFDELNNFLFSRFIFGTNIDPSATGDYTVGGLLPGSYYIQGGDAGFDFYQREVYNNKPCYWSGCDRSTGDPIVLGQGQSVSNIDFLLEYGGKISGTITDFSGFPITDANVQVQFIDSNNIVVGGARAKPDGTYISARALPAGDYAVRTGNLFAGILTQPYINEKYNDIICSGLACDLTTADVNVTINNITTNIDFSLNTGLSFSGTITEVGTGNPIPDVHVLVYKDMGDGTVKFANWATTSDGSNGSSGSFTVSGLPAGTYYAVTNNGHRLPFLGYPHTPGNGWLDILYDGMICPANGCDIISGTPIVLAANKAARAPLTIELSKGASISGQVTDDVLGAPIAEVQINVYNQTGIYYGSYTTDEFGHYKTAGLPADTYFLTTSSFDVLIDTVYGNKPCYFSACNPNEAQPIALSTQQDAITQRLWTRSP